ncbi:MAG: hypothetical protein KatS3mg079_690 [Caloramator sp.]|nr:MAG: hypothetical protein KatS3mg079_690 [Caloramator sp.]
MKYKIITSDFDHTTNEFICTLDFYVEGQTPAEFEYYATDNFRLSLPVTQEQIYEKIKKLGEKHKQYYELQKLLQTEGDIDNIEI